MSKNKEKDIRILVRDRYGKIAETSKEENLDCFQSSCCSDEDPTQLVAVDALYETPDVADLPDEVTDLSLGCGDPVTLAGLSPGETVVDLGSGGGIDCFLAAKQVGETGRVIGVDMTPSMIEKARENKARIGAENVEFRLGEIEHLPVADGFADVIISNCVINLSPDKPQVLRDTFRVLKPGGRISISDIVTRGDLPDEIKNDLGAWVGCVAGAVDEGDYLRMLESAGFVDVELAPTYFGNDYADEAIQYLEEQGNVLEVSRERVQDTIFSAKITGRKPAD